MRTSANRLIGTAAVLLFLGTIAVGSWMLDRHLNWKLFYGKKVETRIEKLEARVESLEEICYEQ